MKLPFSDKGSVSTKKYKVPSEKLHDCGNVEDQRIKGMCSFGDSILPHASLLDKVIRVVPLLRYLHKLSRVPYSFKWGERYR